MSLSIQKSFNETEKYWDVSLSGEADVLNVDELRHVLAEAYGEKQADINIDLSKLIYVDSSGLGVIIGAYGKMKNNGDKIILSNPRENVKRLLRITNMDKFLAP